MSIFALCNDNPAWNHFLWLGDLRKTDPDDHAEPSNSQVEKRTLGRQVGMLGAPVVKRVSFDFFVSPMWTLEADLKLTAETNLVNEAASHVEKLRFVYWAP